MRTMVKKSRIKNAEYLKHPQGSIYEQGYGQIAKLIMTDKDLTIEAKAIYAYLCSFSGGGNQAFPSIQKMCADLRITPKRFYKHFEYILDKGYIIKEQHQDDFGQFTKNIYEIVYILDTPF